MPSEPKTVRVRIAVAVDSQGRWYARGASNETDANSADMAETVMRRGSRVTFVEAPVPLPVVVETVEGTVSNG